MPPQKLSQKGRAASLSLLDGGTAKGDDAGPVGIIGAQFSTDTKHLATASRDNNLILWDTVIGKQIFVFEHERIVICCCFSRDGKMAMAPPPPMVNRGGEKMQLAFFFLHLDATLVKERV